MKKLFGLLALLFAFALPAERAQSIEDVRAAVVSQVLGGQQFAERPADDVLALRVRGVHKQRVTAAVPVTGLNYAPVNQASGGDIALIWDGADLLPRLPHTVIVKYKPAQQTGYYGFLWHTPNLGPPDEVGWDGGQYSWGNHPYPHNTGTVDSEGHRTGGAEAPGSTGVIHYWESAGLLAADDWLSSAGEPGGLLVVKDQWYTQVRKCRLLASGAHSGEIEHTYIPDLIGNPTFKIVVYTANALSTPSAPAFYIGASDWSVYLGGSGSKETTSGIVRGIQLYNAYLTDADHALEAANTTSNTPVTAAGIAAKWYLNQNPTPSDATDKSGAGHNPTWRNANRPTLYTE